MIQIPKQLQKINYRFVLLGIWDMWGRFENIKGKKKLIEKRNYDPSEYSKIDKKIWEPLGKQPFEIGWTKKGYFYNDEKIIKHKGNIGLIAGHDNIRIIDTDSKESTELINKLIPDTYWELTGSGGGHFYVKSEYNINHVFIGIKGEFRANNYQAVIGNCRHPNGNYYKSMNDYNIKEISSSDLIELLKPYIKKKDSAAATPIINKETETEEEDKSRSGREYKEVCSLIGKNIKKDWTHSELYNFVDKEMVHFDKWKNAGEQYRKKTFENAYNFIESKRKEKAEKEKAIFKKNNIDISKINIKEDIIYNIFHKFGDDGLGYEFLTKLFLSKNYIHTIRDDKITELWIYKEGIYMSQGVTYIREFCRNILGKFFTNKVCNTLIDRVAVDTLINKEEFFNKTYPYEIPVLNGILNIKEKKLYSFTPDKIFFNKLPLKYEPEKKIIKINKFLSDILDEKDILIIQELFGFLLLKDYRFQKAIMMVGIGSNGKSQLLILIKKFLGPENCSNISLDELQNNTFASSELFGKLVNIAGDLSKNDIKNTEQFKQLTGGDRIAANRKYMTPIYFVNHAKMIHACNELPKTSDLSDGFFRRWIIISFPYKFCTIYEYELTQDKKNLKIAEEEIIEKITNSDELSGLLNWAIDGLERLFKNNKFSYSQITDNIRKEWICKSNSFAAFCMDHIELDYDSYITKGELRQKYGEYCQQLKLKIENDIIIKKQLIEAGAWEEYININEHDRKWGWKGIKFTQFVNPVKEVTGTSIKVAHTHIQTLYGNTPSQPSQGSQNFKNTHVSEHNTPAGLDMPPQGYSDLHLKLLKEFFSNGMGTIHISAVLDFCDKNNILEKYLDEFIQKAKRSGDIIESPSGYFRWYK